MLRADCENVIGNGVVVHLPTLFEELRQLDDGTDASLERLVVSSRAHVLLDAHRVIDGMIEEVWYDNANFGCGEEVCNGVAYVTIDLPRPEVISYYRLYTGQGDPTNDPLSLIHI